jgi:hypothetical protein
MKPNKKFSNIYLSFLAIGISALSLTNTFAQGFRSQGSEKNKPSQGEIVEVAVQHGFIQKDGYDSNDDVIFFVDSVLPDGCHKPIDTPALMEKVPDSSEIIFKYRQWAEKITDGPCSQRALLDPKNSHLLAQRPFRKEVVLRQIKKLGIAGKFQIYFRSDIKKQTPETFDKVRSFNITLATQTTIDELLYAQVSSVYVADEHDTRNPLEIVLTGILPNPCYDINEKDLEIKLHEDVLVIRPIVRVISQGPCLMVIKPFVIRKEIKDIPLDAGRYLLHVRSKDGDWFNIPFSAI